MIVNLDLPKVSKVTIQEAAISEVKKTFLFKILEFMFMSNQQLEELELKAKNKGIKGYKNMPINKLLSILDASEPIKENFEYTKLKPFKNTKKSR